MNLTLHEITDDYLRAIDQLSDEPDPQKAQDILECIGGSLQQKASNVALFYRNLEAIGDAIEDEIKRLQGKQAAITAKQERLLGYLAGNLKRAGITRIEDSPLVTIKFAKNPASVDVLAESQIPEQFWVQPEPPPKRLDKRAILAALKQGEDVPGACIKQGERLVIE